MICRSQSKSLTAKLAEEVANASAQRRSDRAAVEELEQARQADRGRLTALQASLAEVEGANARLLAAQKP